MGFGNEPYSSKGNSLTGEREDKFKEAEIFFRLRVHTKLNTTY